MVLNSTVISNSYIEEDTVEQNPRSMVVNTTDFNNRDLEEFVNISEEIERSQRQRRSQRRRSRSRSNTVVVATMTREEIFESTNVDDDQFLNSLEDQTSWEAVKNRKALVNSIENLMKYFDEDIAVVDDSSAKATPTKRPPKGKVASAVASFRKKCNMTPSPMVKRKKQQQQLDVEVKANIKELKKKYESSMEVEASPSPKPGKQKSPKSSRKSKVKQMALLFNSKINSMIRSSSPEPQTPEPLSPTLSSLPASPSFTSTLKPTSPKLKPKLATFLAKLPSPKPSPLFKRKQLQKSPSLNSLNSSSPLMRRKQLQKQPSTTCLIAESVFSQLSVKDKALLYNKFIADMSKQNPKFSKHAEVLESNVQKEVQRGEVICEKHGSVKQLRESLEAKLTPNKTASKTLERYKRSPSEYSLNATPNKSKEYEDISQNECSTTPLPDETQDLLHVSTLTVVLKPSPDSKKSATKPRTTRKRRDVRFLTDLNIIEPSLKRTQNMIRSSIPVEPYAPPKKIRRFRHERLAPKMFFQNQHLEKLFYNWLKEKNGVAFDITTVNNENIIEIVPKNSSDFVIPKKEIDKILEEAINKLEDQRQQEIINNQQKEENAIALIKETLKTEKLLERSVIEVELPLEMEIPETTVIKISDELNETEDSDMGLTSITKTTSEESHTELKTNEFLKPCSKTLRKKKLRRSLTWKKDNSLVETNAIFSTDSDSDCKSQNLKMLNCTLPKTKKCSNYVKKLLFKTINSSATSESNTISSITPELSILELDRSLIRQVNSPSKIKTAYTLTVMSSPSPHSESDFCESDLPRLSLKEASRSWPSLLEVGMDEDSNLLKDKSVTTEFTDLAKSKLEQEQQKLLMDSFIDQGFETGSNDMESPMRLPRKPPMMSSNKNATFDIENRSLTNEENPKNFSTPDKDKPVQKTFTAQINGAPHNLISPISPANRIPSSLIMQSIQEDISMEDSDQFQHTPSSLNESATFFSNEPMPNITESPLSKTHKVESSQFWISAGEFTAAIAIQPYESERLMLLSNIFAQKSLETKEMNFGIDEHKFCINNSAASEDIVKKLPKEANCSQYWFSTGDVLIPFKGKQMSAKKIQAFFNYILEFVEDSGSLRFGIDTYEFSNIYQQSQNCPSHLNSNTWSQAASSLKTSDLDQSDVESEEFEQSISFSAISGNHSDTASLKSDDILNHKNNYSPVQAAESLEQIFEDARLLNLSKTHTDKLAQQSQFTVPEMLKTLQHQQLKLKSLEERMLNCAKSSSQKHEDINESPEYMRKLRSIISAIDNIGRGNGFNACSIEQLESFMFFLSRYADLCLANCTAHIEKILDVVMTQRSYQA